MKINGISPETPNNAWEIYENYRRNLWQEKAPNTTPAVNATGTQEAPQTKQMNKAEGCQTCKNRKYQDGSNDPGVSFKTPSRIAPEQAAAVVRGHEQEHVNREQGKAQRENREVVSQSVTYHTAICPECGSSYVSGGTTRTVTRGSSEPEGQEQSQAKPKAGGFDQRV